MFYGGQLILYLPQPFGDTRLPQSLEPRSLGKAQFPLPGVISHFLQLGQLFVSSLPGPPSHSSSSHSSSPSPLRGYSFWPGFPLPWGLKSLEEWLISSFSTEARTGRPLLYMCQGAWTGPCVFLVDGVGRVTSQCSILIKRLVNHLYFHSTSFNL